MAESKVSYECGLCKSNDHHITSPTCPTKRKATETLRRRQNHRLQAVKMNAFAVPTANRFTALQWDEEDWPDLPDLCSAPEQPVLYSDAARQGGRRRQKNSVQHPPITEPDDVDTAAIDGQIAKLLAEVTKLRRHRELLLRRKRPDQRTDLSSTPAPTMRQPPPFFGSQNSSVIPDNSTSSLLRFMVNQLSHLTSVLLQRLDS